MTIGGIGTQLATPPTNERRAEGANDEDVQGVTEGDYSRRKIALCALFECRCGCFLLPHSAPRGTAFFGGALCEFHTLPHTETF